MKETELRERCVCDSCGKKIGECILPLFYVLTLERFGLDLKACERQQGLTMMLGGNAALAQIMGTDEDLAKPVMDKRTITICEECATKEFCVHVLAEFGMKEEEQA